MIHLFRWNPAAIAVPPDGQKAAEKYRRGTHECALCRALTGFIVKYELDHAGDCPGLVTP